MQPIYRPMTIKPPTFKVTLTERDMALILMFLHGARDHFERRDQQEAIDDLDVTLEKLAMAVIKESASWN